MSDTPLTGRAFGVVYTIHSPRTMTFRLALAAFIGSLRAAWLAWRTP